MQIYLDTDVCKKISLYKCICYAQRLKTLTELIQQHVVALEKQLQHEIVCCGMRETTTIRNVF